MGLQERFMKQIFVKAGIYTLVSIVVSVGLCAAILAWMGSSLDSFAIVLSAGCPLVLAFPLSFHSLRQQQKLERAHAELAIAHAALAEQARHDDLTGLLNRSAFIAAVNSTQSMPVRGSLLLIDADDFKTINDTYGHVVGDQAVCIIAQIIKDVLAASDLKARVGGDEFGVFFPMLSLNDARDKAERIRRSVELAEFRPQLGERIPLSVSIGVIPVEPGATFTEIMEAADQQLYEAKGKGRNAIAYPQPKAA